MRPPPSHPPMMVETLDFDLLCLLLFNVNMSCVCAVFFIFQRIWDRFLARGLIQDRSIPQELLSRAKGLAFLTVIKGCVVVWCRGWRNSCVDF